MGGSSWSSSLYDDRTATRAKTGTPAFAYSAAVSSGAVAKAVHASMDPKVIAGAGSPHAGKVMRESRDSDVHPESLAIGVLFDVTGSMGQIPQVLETKLAGLMALLLQKGYVAHPQILFGAVGDAYSDHVPLQVGQFESGLEMDDVLTNVYLEGNGGGQMSESYELPLYFFARHTSTDCYEKRGQKGYLFTMGDENYYDFVSKDQVKALIGDSLQANVPTKNIVAELTEKWNYFHIIIEEGSYPHNKTIENSWRDLLGERVLLLEDKNNVAELIALTIGLTEGTIDIDSAKADLKSVGLNDRAIKTVTAALVPLSKASGGAMSKATVSGDLPVLGGGGLGRV